jgi:hypothetical protein
MNLSTAMADNEKVSGPFPPRPMGETPRASQPPGPMRRPISTIPPPPLPVVQPHIPLPIPHNDDDCVTKRFYVNVFQPVASEAALMEDSEPSVDVIEIDMDEAPAEEYRRSFFETDEDAVTKEIRIERLAQIASSNTDHSAAVRVRTLPTDDTLQRTGVSRRASNRVDAIVPNPRKALFLSVRAAIKRILAVFSQSRPRIRRHLPRLIKGDGPHTGRLRLSVNTYTRELYREIRHALNPKPGTAPLAIDNSGFSITVSTPPQIAVNAMLLRRADKHSLLIRGRASHPVSIRDIMVFAEKKKILYLSNAARDDAGYMEFSADVPLEGAVNSIVVIARHNEKVMGSQSLVIKKTD